MRDLHAKAALALLAALAALGCGADRRPAAGDPDGGSPDSGADAGADADADTDADPDADAGADGGAACADPGYPGGPYAWEPGGVVPDTAFPAIFGGEVGTLFLAAIYCTETRSLVFALGADT